MNNAVSLWQTITGLITKNYRIIENIFQPIMKKVKLFKCSFFYKDDSLTPEKTKCAFIVRYAYHRKSKLWQSII